MLRHICLTACFTLLSLFATGQTKTPDNDQWLKMITANAINHSKENSFAKVPWGYALYFSQAGNINVPYIVYVPKNYDPAHPHPAVVFLHGAILARDSFQYKSAETANEPVFSVADTFNAIVIFPFARQDFKWSGGQPAAYENIISIIRHAEQVYNIDKKRIYIGGISMGGNATFWFINNKPDVFAGFYTFSAMPHAGDAPIKFSNLTKDKPLYSLNAKDDPVFPYTEVETAYQNHKNEAPGWHFATVETGGHRFIYNSNGKNYIISLVGKLLKN